MYGTDYPYAQTRIAGTVVRLAKDNYPVYILNVDTHSGICDVIRIDSGEWDYDNSEQVHLDDLNLRPVPLGYINQGNGAYYFMRVPMRRDWKQGVRSENCTGPNRLFSMNMSNVSRCIRGIYPEFAQSLHNVLNSRVTKTIAWDRHWAVGSGGVLYYKNNLQVGTITKGGTATFNPQHSYLNDILKEVIK